MSQATLGSTPYQNSSLFSGYYLDERIYDLDDWDCDEEASEAFDDLQVLWDLERDLVDSYNEDELLDAWIDEVLDVLGYDTLSETTLPDSGGYNDRLLFDSAETRRKAAKRKKEGDVEAAYSLASVALEAKQWNADFTARFSEQRSYRDASHQIKYYLEHTPDNLQWGILTDGRKWRLYGTKDYATEIYYEVDLPELLNSGSLEQFKYFFAFFRPEAFRETAGTSFLDTVWNESETAAQELGEDLQDNVFTALRVLGEGFLHTNDLDIDPDDEAAREELKEQSLVLLYRLMFVLYAESRGLIHPEDPDKQDEYEDHFSLDQLRSEIHDDIQSGDDFEDYSGYSTQMWGRLEDLFDLVDEGQESLGIPPYNGGLFDDDQHGFLAENEVSDRHIAEVIYRLGTTEGDDGGFVLADYADLDTRHLGSIYEGLLEHEFRIASEQYAAVTADGGQVWKPATEVSVADAVETVEEGELYVVNDDGERKATGAYYTPDYVVSYIVEETIDPLLEDIKDDLRADGLEESDREFFQRFWQDVQELKILDPAMGSAHFLTSATGYLTEQVMEVVREQEIQSYDEQHLRREIAKECIYGVDVNGMAVELGKLSMWLETLAADQPLAFLDHHLKTGNSLVGSDITEVLSDDNGGEDGQLTLMQAAARARKNTLEHVMELMQELLAIDNETLEDIKSMEEIYDEIRDDPLYQRLFEIANVHTAEEFGLDVPEGVYEEMAGAIEDAEDWGGGGLCGEDCFRPAQALPNEETFSHWDLEHPEVFFGNDGEKREDAGFDAVIGNPPYVSSRNEDFYERMQKFIDSHFEVATYQVDTYFLFTELASSLAKENGYFSYIIPDSWVASVKSDEFRKWLTSDATVQTIALPENPVFEADVDCLVLSAKGQKEQESNLQVQSLTRNSVETVGSVSLPEDGSVFALTPHGKLLDKVNSSARELDEIALTGRGIGPYHHSVHDEEVIENREFHSDTKEDETYRPELAGKNLNRYLIDWDGGRWISYGDWLAEPRTPELFEGSRVLCRKILSDRLCCTYTDDDWLVDQQVYVASQFSDGYDARYVAAVLASTLMGFYAKKQYHEDTELFPHLRVSQFRELPIHGIDFDSDKPADFDQRIRRDYQEVVAGDETGSEFTDNHSCGEKLHDYLAFLVEEIIETKERKTKLNENLLDHLSQYEEGETLSNIGFTQPPEGSANSVLHQTTEQKPNLRVGEATVKRESENTVEIQLTARYKPDDEDAHDTDQWGYTETDPLPALRITDLTETEADLIEAFVPVAVDEADGFANFRETATKTNSLVDRLRKLTLPAVDDVREGLESYLETKERAEELESKIERTDDLIDEIVYELYGLTDEEIEIVENEV